MLITLLRNCKGGGSDAEKVEVPQIPHIDSTESCYGWRQLQHRSRCCGKGLGWSVQKPQTKLPAVYLKADKGMADSWNNGRALLRDRSRALAFRRIE
jgi:hypothetical protein